MKSFITELYLVNQDFLQLLGRKQRQASVSKELEKEFEVIHSFYVVVLNILHRADIECQTLNVKRVNDHVTSKILEEELRKTYNELYKRGHTECLSVLIKSTPILSKKELEQSTILK